MALWLPGYERVDLGLDGKPFEYTHNPKGLLHSTEGTSLAGAEQAMRAYPSHLGYDYRIREKHQYISLDLAAYSAMDQSDDDPIFQVELVGFAKDMRYLPDWALWNIAEDVIKPLADTVGIPGIAIPVGFKDGLDGIFPYLASPESPIRLSYAGLRQFSGWLGHQHLPAPDDHWDPGAINVNRLIELAYGDDDLNEQQDAYLREIWQAVAPREGGLDRLHRHVNFLGNLTVAQAAEVKRKVDEKTVPVNLSPEDLQAIINALAASLPIDTIARAVVAEFKKEGN